MTQLILGSQSPRRKEILSFFSLPFVAVTSNFDEDSVPFNDNPTEYVCEIATSKARALVPLFPDDLILTADTTVYKSGKIYGKPKDPEDAFQALSELAGDWHSVYTGITLISNHHVWSAFEETRVLFNPLTPEEIRHYHKKLHWSDKAGGYAIQMAGGLAVNKIDGCYYNVMGLPINSVRKLLLNVDIDLWDYLK
ncbi:MAG TPA: nucleoside triphosphate pyrophosphatase [Parachlamydiaceae bacterium]|nr:nucleoside triphosphate pyrophosphatase [Parachlamydiaceae bacterium]